MDRADFIHLVRLSEHASAADSTGYRRSVAAFAALGYAFVVGCLLAGAALLYWGLHAILFGKFRGYHAWVLISAAGLLWASGRALWLRFDRPDGVLLREKDAPALFESLERIRRKVKGPPIHDVYLDADLNASIGQRPRWGLFGGARNHLSIGLTMLMAVDRQRLLAVLAHEYGHLRGDHGRFAAWIYRTRASWSRLNEGLGQDEGLAGWITQGFLGWYFPRFIARTFALARQDEYEADRISGKLLGREVAGAVLVETSVKGDWLEQEFWGRHWAQAAGQPLPVGPYRGMRAELSLAVPDDFARASLRQALRRLSGVDDTHPGLRDRLDALDVAPALPAWSRKPALDLLGDPERWIAHFDKQWCAEHASAWKQHHAYLGRVRARVDQLRAQARKEAKDWSELGNLQRRLDPQAKVRDCFEQALALAPTDAIALRGLHGCIPEAQGAERLACLERLHEAAPDQRWWAARAAVAQLEDDPGHDAQVLKKWRERFKQGEAAEERAWAELSTPPFAVAGARADLNEFERAELQAELADWPDVARAWLLRKGVREFPNRRCFVLVVDLPHLDDGSRWEVCRALERAAPVPGHLLVLATGSDLSARDAERHAGGAIYPVAA